ncbi:hypothetical protein [Corallococcus llansteffanensis]|uniref:Uncharacterized protein n=1 Tax=Corallococcus llansteffanensis TaxID=2316731 RepID=A0A3A8QKD2_9BACT|nr:hypothetical protein [Corallococcus llansteffanensis]RKH68278.1 hypothetical protein D7V93_01550 [Corallococcus llansteffanensis]
MPVRIGKIALAGLANIYTEDTRTLVQQRAPGQAGAVFQDLGREPVTVVMEGVLVGEDTLAGVEELRQAQDKAKPLSFAADAVAGADLTQVLIADFQVKQLAGYTQRHAFFLRVREYVEPPATAQAGTAAVSKKVAATAGKWNKGALAAASVLKKPDTLMSAVRKDSSLLKHLSAGQLGGVLNKIRGSLTGRDFSTVLSALGKMDPGKIVGLVNSLKNSGSIGEFVQKLAADGVPLLEQMTGLKLGAAAAVVKGIAGASDFLSKLQQVARDAGELATRVSRFDPVASLEQPGGPPT